MNIDIKTVLKKRPRMKDVSLKDIALFYKESLCLEDVIVETEGERWILSADIENFCHLIGLHKLKLPPHFGHPIRGQRGFEAILNEDVTFRVLKSHDPGGVKQLIDRLLYLFFVNQMMTPQHVYRFSPLKVYHCKIKGELMFAVADAFGERDQIYLHFIWGKSSQIQCLIPTSFFVERCESIYFKNNQPPLDVVRIERVSRMTQEINVDTIAE